ncbi:MAG TPA: thioredoxin family protein [Membranihabitans sp.]|nr:thioredoxin family protein [Membranihabitans sp.]
MKTQLLWTLFLLWIFQGISIAMSIHENSPPSSETSGIDIGDKAPHFNLQNVDGKMYSLDAIKDANGDKPKGYIIVFTCNTCPFAKANEERLINLHQTYAPRGYPVVAIQPNNPEVKPGDSFEAMKKNASEKGFPFLYLMDEQQSVYPAYGATKTPEVFLLDADFILRYHGAIDDSPQTANNVDEKYLENALAALDQGRSPDLNKTKSIGCAIQ